MLMTFSVYITLIVWVPVNVAFVPLFGSKLEEYINACRVSIIPINQ